MYSNNSYDYTSGTNFPKTHENQGNQRQHSYFQNYTQNYNFINVPQVELADNKHRSNGCTEFQETTWENRVPNEKRPELLPVNYANEFFGNNFYKNIHKDYYNKYESQWYTSNCSNLKNNYSSCAQVTQNFSNEKTVKYCSIQNNEFEVSTKTFTFNNDYFSAEAGQMQKPVSKNNEEISNYPFCNYFDQKSDSSNNALQMPYFNIDADVNNLEFGQLPIEPNEDSNDDSDIVVEDTDDYITDYSEDHENKRYRNKCFICNVAFVPIGLQFYFLKMDTPVTMSTQKPVWKEVNNILGTGKTFHKYLCNECLGLINSIDHFQLKLKSFQNELLNKFSNTCKLNNIKNENRKIKNINKLPKYKCRYCKKVLSLKLVCQNHIRKHRRKKCLCEVCGKFFLSRNVFKKHLNIHKKSKVVKISAFQCMNCKKSFRTKTNLKEHQHYCYGTLPYKCKYQQCDKKFASSTKLKNHIKLKHDKKFIAICSICNIGFTRISDYKSHMTTHGTEKKFECKQCKKTYKTLSNLNFHLKSHSIKLPFICKICRKGFMRKEYLEAHVNNHNGIKNFVCNMCSKAFVCQKNLDAHMKYHDGSIVKKKCNICGKSLSTNFEEHLRIHNNLREFECGECHTRFNTKGTLSKHRKSKHGIQFKLDGDDNG